MQVLILLTKPVNLLKCIVYNLIRLFNLEKKMAENNNESLEKAQIFFKRAQEATERKNFDYAVEMYLEGIKCAPDELENGHLKLYSLGLHRLEKGGKKPTMMEKVKLMREKDPLEQMINAEHLLAKDPKNFSYAQTMLKAASAGGYEKTAKWVADMIFQHENSAKKPSASTYLLLKGAYEKIKEFDRSLMACQKAVELKPKDGELADEFKRLSAELTVSRGKYDQEGDFRNSINNRQAQEKLQSQEGVVKNDDYKLSALNEAKKAYAEDMELPKNIYNLTNALVDMQNDNSDNQAIAILTKAYNTKNDFSYMKEANQIRISQVKRKIRKGKAFIEKRPDDEKAKKILAELSGKLLQVELKHYQLCVKNYPTDLGMKYEYGTKLLKNQQFDEAIPYLQESQRDPKHKVAAMSKIGQCFFLKGWHSDAVDIFNQAIEIYSSKDDGIAKELRYNLARAYEEQGDKENALDVYRKIAQIDFGYRDVRQRVDKLRTQ